MAQSISESISANKFRIQFGGETAVCSADDFKTVCDAVVARHPGVEGVPQVTPLVSESVISVKQSIPAAVVTTEGVDITGGVSRSAAERGARDERIAVENGFVLADPLFSLGTLVNSTGVENATRSQLEHDQKPFAKEICEGLVRQVRSERRQDLTPIRVSQLRMATSGKLRVEGGHPVHSNMCLPITDRMFASLMARFPCASGIAYLNDCSPRLRAINFNHWAVELGNREMATESTDWKEAILRVRTINGMRAGYAAVSPRYTAFDADKIGAALQLAFPDDARGSLDYDGERIRVEGLWHTDVKPTEFAAGEIFKAGVIVRSDDTGSGSIRIQSVVWRNLCQNLIILDRAIGVDVRLRHRGSVNSLACSFRTAFGKALSSVDAFRVAWNRARCERDEVLVESVQGTTRDDLIGKPVSAILPGIFTGILQREKVPMGGRVVDVVPKLLEMHRQDEAASQYGVSRASIVNAFTRYAHQVETDPFKADRIREMAGSLLSGSRGREPAPLPYIAVA